MENGCDYLDACLKPFYLSDKIAIWQENDSEEPIECSACLSISDELSSKSNNNDF